MTILAVQIARSQSIKTARGYCDFICPLPAEHNGHFDPYYNHHLCENFNPKQQDFSKEYLTLRTRSAPKNEVRSLLPFDISPVWVSVDKHQNGIIGLDCKRIKMFITSATKDNYDSLLYHIEGKSNVDGNICDFKGNIKVIQSYRYSYTHNDSAGEYFYGLFAEYRLDEDIRQKGSGTFRGIMECFYTLNQETMKASLDEERAIADGYFNRSYVGTWTSANTRAVKKCIWGDYRLPFSFDFDCGDGEMNVCDKYVSNGWATFNSQQEYRTVGDKWELIDKWWLNNTSPESR